MVAQTGADDTDSAENRMMDTVGVVGVVAGDDVVVVEYGVGTGSANNAEEDKCFGSGSDANSD